MNISGIALEAGSSNVVQENKPQAISSVRKGDIVEGVVKNVSDKITIDFSGKEIDFPISTVHDAREGEKVKFQIMDVSNERIVLKALGNTGEDAGSQVAFTKVETSSTTDILEQGTSEKEVRSQSNNHIVNTTIEDIKTISNAESGIYVSIEKYTLEAFDRLLEAISEEKILLQSAIDGQTERIEKIQKAIEKSVSAGRLPEGISSALAEYFVRYDIPVTEDNLQNISVGIAQMDSISKIDDKSICYILKHELDITVQNIYNATYSYMTLNNSGDVKAYEDVKPQIMNIVKNAGYQWDDDIENNMKLLFDNDIAINEETLKKLDIMQGMKEETFDKKQILEQMVKELDNGGKSNQTVIVNNLEVSEEIKEYINLKKEISIISMRDIQSVLAANRPVSIKELKGALKDSGKYADFDNVTSDVIKVKRQLEEIRLTMTLKASRTLKNSGIDIETTELSKLVENLRNIEKEQYQKELAGYGIITDNEADTIAVTEQYRRDIAMAPSYMLGEFARTGMRETIAEYADKAVVMTDRIKLATHSYETLMTEPRKDMGDSINKAFRNIDALLEDVGVDVTEENRRVVKILAHNRMEITASNVNMMREYDARVEKLLDNLRPQTTLELIRQGINPLLIPFEELEDYVTEINANVNAESESGAGGFNETAHSEFLWKLEKEHRISEDERASYIGICRLLHQISKNDRAAVGAVVNSGVEFTLNNLLTAVRSKDRGIEADVDDLYGERVSDADTRQIENQINKGYVSYNELVVDKLLNAVTPSKLYEISGGDISKIYNKSLEGLLDELISIPENEQLEDEFMEYEAELVRQTAKDIEAIRYADVYGIEPTIYNLNAVRTLLNQNRSVIGKMLNDSEESSNKDELESECEKLVEAFEDEESANQQYGKMLEAARHLYEMSERRGKIDVAALQGLSISSHMAKRRSYEIPVVTEQGVTSINLTIVDGARSRKEISIRMESQKFGEINLELGIKKNNVQALLVTSHRTSDNDLSELVNESIRKNEYTLVSFNSVIISNKKMYSPPEKEWDTSSESQLKRMYKLSKDIVKGLSDMIKEEQL